MLVSTQKIWIFIWTLVWVFSYSSEAQVITGKTNRNRAQQAIVSLHNGALIFRMKSKRNKIEKLEEALATPDLKESDRKRLNKELESTIKERDEYNSEMVAAFGNYYNFSAVYFMYDTSSVVLKDGQKSGFLLNEKLEIDPDITIVQDSFFVIYNGNLDATNSTGMEALIIMDSQFEQLSNPFPYYIKSNDFWRSLGRFFSPKGAIKRDAKKVVIKLDQNLNKFYEKTISKP